MHGDEFDKNDHSNLWITLILLMYNLYARFMSHNSLNLLLHSIHIKEIVFKFYLDNIVAFVVAWTIFESFQTMFDQ